MKMTTAINTIDTVIRQIYAQARLLGCCDLFRGTEDLQGIIRLFTSPQGVEFCIKHHFPNLATLRLFKTQGVEQYGIYIDAGTVTLTNPGRVILIGRTTATVNCSTMERYEVILLHGAKAAINASKWAVVFVTAEQGCSVIRSTSENALIL